jgi:hypothetical protein
MPIDNYNALQQMTLVDMGLGSDVSAFSNHLEKLTAYVQHDQKVEAKQEIYNMILGYNNAMNDITTDSFSILPFMESINGKAYILGDLEKSKADLKFLSDNGLTVKILDETLSTVKKNFKLNFNRPSHIDLMELIEKIS